MKTKWLPISLIIFAGVIILGLISPAPSLILFMSDAYFLISAVMLIIGLLGWVLKNGTFDFFHYSLNRAKQALFDRRKSFHGNKEDAPNKKDLHRLSGSIPHSYVSFIKAGALFLAASILCTLIYYL